MVAVDNLFQKIKLDDFDEKHVNVSKVLTKYIVSWDKQKDKE